MRVVAGLLSEVKGVFCETCGRAPCFRKEPIGREARSPSNLRALFFEDDLGLAGGQLFLTDGAGYIAERRRRWGHGAKFP